MMTTFMVLFFLFFPGVSEVFGQDGSLGCLSAEINRIVNGNEKSIVSVVSYITLPESGETRRRVSTGFAIENAEYILTATEGVLDADSIYIVSSGGERFRAILAGNDQFVHLALLKSESTIPSSLKIRSIEQIKKGDLVLVVGNTFGFQTSASLGLVSGFDISIQTGNCRHDGLVQINTPVAPGAIGATVFDIRGEVVGMLVASAPKLGISFAIPGERLQRSIAKMINEKIPKYAYLGVVIREIPKNIACQGVEIVSVDMSSPAEEADLKPGDIITVCGGSNVVSARQLRDLVAFSTVGGDTQFSIVRQGKQIDTSITLSEIPSRPVMPQHVRKLQFPAMEMQEVIERLLRAENAIEQLQEKQAATTGSEPADD